MAIKTKRKQATDRKDYHRQYYQNHKLERVAYQKRYRQSKEGTVAIRRCCTCVFFILGYDNKPCGCDKRIDVNNNGCSFYQECQQCSYCGILIGPNRFMRQANYIDEKTICGLCYEDYLRSRSRSNHNNAEAGVGSRRESAPAGEK